MVAVCVILPCHRVCSWVASQAIVGPAVEVARQDGNPAGSRFVVSGFMAEALKRGIQPFNVGHTLAVGVSGRVLN
jgi:hypothetical protein